MAFAQLTCRESLRDIEVCHSAQAATQSMGRNNNVLTLDTLRR